MYQAHIDRALEVHSRRKLQDSIPTPFQPERIFAHLENQLPKAIIVGMDPYPRNCDAIGPAFALPDEFPRPVSLSNLAKWADNRILLYKPITFFENHKILSVNVALTTLPNNAGVHFQIWLPWFLELLHDINRRSKNIIPVLFLGANAQTAFRQFQAKWSSACNIDAFLAPHPAARYTVTPESLLPAKLFFRAILNGVVQTQLNGGEEIPLDQCVNVPKIQTQRVKKFYWFGPEGLQVCLGGEECVLRSHTTYEFAKDTEILDIDQRQLRRVYRLFV